MASIYDNNLVNPCEIWINFKQGTNQGFFQGYDKTILEESERKINLGESLNIIPLFVHNGVTGYNNASDSAFYSNEVEDLNEEILNVKLGNKLFCSGLWKDISDKVVAKGGKFAIVVYFAFFERKPEGIIPKIGCMKFSGSTANAWIESNIRINECKLLILKKGVLIDNRVSNGKIKKLDNPYWSIMIEKHSKNDKLLETALSLGVPLKGYFEEYFKKENQTLSIEEDSRNELPPKEEPKQLSIDNNIEDINLSLSEANEYEENEDFNTDTLPF